MVNGWKIATIILSILLILIAGLGFWIYSAGVDVLEKERECAYNVCVDNPKIVSYYYDIYEEVCECYDEAGFRIKQKYLG